MVVSAVDVVIIVVVPIVVFLLMLVGLGALIRQVFVNLFDLSLVLVNVLW